MFFSWIYKVLGGHNSDEECLLPWDLHTMIESMI